MKEFIDKLIERLEEEKEGYSDTTYYALGIGSAIKIVNKLAEEYKVSEMPTGWIPCSDMLPENISTVLVQVKEFESPTIGWYGNMIGWRLAEKDFDELNDFTVIAWQPLPALPKPYKKGE